MTKSKIDDGTQFAALPCRVMADGSRQVMLVTSRETRRWIIPKGWPMKGCKPAMVAEREAYEEAGLQGRIVGKNPIGTYHYTKRMNPDEILCEVQVYLLWVDRQLDDWPEKGQRETRWFDPIDAADRVAEGGLAELIRSDIVTRSPLIGARERALFLQPQPAG